MDVSPVIERLAQAHPDAACALTHEDPFQLLVATILSAQCTDARVNMVTPELFRRYPDARAMSGAAQADLEQIIRTTGFFRNKSKSIRGASQRLVEAFGGTVPRTMDELLTLPGVARKTANVVLGVGHGLAEGIVVDTHVFRVARRLGLSRGRNPIEIERDLMRQVPRDQWILFSHLLIFHGRRVCTARKPRCQACAVFELCPSGPYYVRGKVPPWDHRAAGPARPAGKKAAARKKKVTARKPARKKTAAARRPAAKKATTRRRAR